MNHRFSKGLQFQGNYVFSKVLTSQFYGNRELQGGLTFRF